MKKVSIIVAAIAVAVTYVSYSGIGQPSITRMEAVITTTSEVSGTVVAVDNSAAIAWQRKLIARAQHATWKCQDGLGIARTKASRYRAGTTSIPYLVWKRDLWRARAAKCWKESASGGAVRHKLGDGLRGTPLAGSERELEQESRRANFNPYVIVGASGVESSFGAAACYGNPYNIWGLGACGRAWHEPYFATRREAYRYFIKFIRSHWPSAKTVYEFYGYCVPASRCGAPLWGARAMDKARQLFGPVSPSLKYPTS